MSAHKRPEPLVTKAKLTAVITALVSLCVTLGILPRATGDAISTQLDLILAASGVVWSSVPVLIHAWRARKDVTPSADPRDNDGNKLVPAGSAQAEPDAVIALRAAEAIFPTL